MSGSGGAKAKPSEQQIYQQFQEFLRCPIWILPVMSFIEQRSLLFDRDQEDEKLFKSVHEEYASMVDMLIGCFCEDLKVDIKDVVKAVEKAAPQVRTESEKNVIEPVIAAQDYNVFLHMMMRKNIELQLQALHMLEVVYGIVPAILVPGTAADGSTDQEQIIMIEVIRKSQHEFERATKLTQEEKQEMELALQESLTDKERLERERLREQEMLDKAMELSLEDTKNTPVAAPVAAPADKDSGAVAQTDKDSSGVAQSQSQPAKRRTANAKAVVELGPVKSVTRGEAPPPPKSPSNDKSAVGDVEPHPTPEATGASKAKLKPKANPIPDDLELRKKYLLEQRNRLLELKKAERQKAFSTAESDTKTSRPKTAKAARNVMSGQGGPAAAGISRDVLAARKALADKLKAELAAPK